MSKKIERPKAVAGEKIAQTPLIPDGFIQVKLGEGEQYLSSVNAETKLIPTTIAPEGTWLVVDHDMKRFIWIPRHPARDELLKQYSKGRRLLIQRFKRFLLVKITQQDPKFIVAQMKPKGE